MTEIRIIKKRKDFLKVAKQGQKVVQSTLILQAAFNLSPELGCCHLGYTATKKLGKAHIRNRTKRRLRAAARVIFGMNGLEGVQYVLIGRYRTADCPFEQLLKEMQHALKKINKLLQKEEAPHEQTAEPTTNSAN